MTPSRRLGVESFEDRVLPSGPGPGPSPYHGPGPAVVRDGGFEHAPPPPGPAVAAPAREHAPPANDPAAATEFRAAGDTLDTSGDSTPDDSPPADPRPPAAVMSRSTPTPRAATVADPSDTPGTAVVVAHASPAGLAVVLPLAFVEATTRTGLPNAGRFGPADGGPIVTQTSLAFPPGLPILTSSQSEPDAADPGPAGPPVVLAEEPTDPPPDVAPVVVDPPAGSPVAGMLGIDAAAVEDHARRFLGRVSDLAADLADGPDGREWYVWVGVAAVLAGGAGCAAWATRSRPRPVLATADSVLARWGEGHDGRAD